MTNVCKITGQRDFHPVEGEANLRLVTPASSSASRPIDQITDAYRLRYAAYLASTFHISVEAAAVEAAFQLSPRRPSEWSESDVYRV